MKYILCTIASEVYTIVFNVSSGSNISVTVGQISNSADLTNLQQQVRRDNLSE